MTIEQAFVWKLREALADLCGRRIYRDAYPQADSGQQSWPCVVYQHTDEDDLVCLSGGRSDTRRDTFTVEVWSDDSGDCEAVRDRLRDTFAGANCRGRWGGVAGVFVCGATAGNAGGDYEPPQQADESIDRAERLSVVITWDRKL